MNGSKKKRLSMLDGLAAAGAGGAMPTAKSAGSMMSANRALRSARDAVDAHKVWELDPDSIEDTRITDRLDPNDIADLRAAIEANGQTVPILVRRHPGAEGRYLLVYGRRRLEAIRQSEKVATVRALVAQLDEAEATRAQISENMARRDLSFIEKALFARELVESGFGTQSHVAEVLTVTKSAISMALSVVDTVTPDLARAIGPAPGVGRPRWEALARLIAQIGPDLEQLTQEAAGLRRAAQGSDMDPSVAAFEALLAGLTPAPAAQGAPKAAKPKPKALQAAGQRLGTMRRAPQGLRVDLADGAFAHWFETHAETLLAEIHGRWQAEQE